MSTDSSEDAVDNTDFRLLSRNECARLSQDSNESGLPEISRLSTHVGSG